MQVVTVTGTGEATKGIWVYGSSIPWIIEKVLNYIYRKENEELTKKELCKFL
jgi:hypothetical protein